MNEYSDKISYPIDNIQILARLQMLPYPGQPDTPMRRILRAGMKDFWQCLRGRGHRSGTGSPDCVMLQEIAVADLYLEPSVIPNWCEALGIDLSALRSHAIATIPEIKRLWTQIQKHDPRLKKCRVCKREFYPGPGELRVCSEICADNDIVQQKNRRQAFRKELLRSRPSPNGARYSLGKVASRKSPS